MAHFVSISSTEDRVLAQKIFFNEVKSGHLKMYPSKSVNLKKSQVNKLTNLEGIMTLEKGGGGNSLKFDKMSKLLC